MKMKYVQAVHNTVLHQMKKNEKIIILGQDVRWWGGSSAEFLGFYKEFGNRIIDTPISEAGTVSVAIGAAMSGMRPIVEFSFFDFILEAMDPIINQAAKIKHFSNAKFKIPLVIRAVIASHRGYGGTHSQNLEHMFMYPGLNVVYPSNPNDAAALMKSSLEYDEPVIFLEHKLLHEMEGDVSDHNVPIGKAEVKHKGNQITIITYGRSVNTCLEFAKEYDVEVLDLRSLKPLDKDSIIKAAEKTGKVLIIEEGHGFVSALIESVVSENTKAVSRRLCTKEVPIPAAETLENYVLVTKEKIKESIENLIKLK